MKKNKAIPFRVSEEMHTKLKKAFPQNISKKLREQLEVCLDKEDKHIKEFTNCMRCIILLEKKKLKEFNIDEMIVTTPIEAEKGSKEVYQYILCPDCFDYLILNEEELLEKKDKYKDESKFPFALGMSNILCCLIKGNNHHVARVYSDLCKYFPKKWKVNSGRITSCLNNEEEMLEQFKKINRIKGVTNK